MAETDDPILPPEPEAAADAAPEAAPVSPLEPVALPEALEPVASLAPVVPDEPLDDTDDEPLVPIVVAETATGRLIPPAPPAAKRPDLIDRREPLYRECRGFRLRLDPPDLARLRELAGSRGKSDDELGEAFFDGQADRLAASLVDDVPAGNEIRVVVDPYSRQAFLALENRIRGILSF
jgi:hypothetical protein